ncbi:MAG TPA: VIT and VWA domain-containing protein [Kofleriaceae bacterium]
MQRDERLEATMSVGGEVAAGPSIPLREEHLRVTVDGQHASSTLTQVYQPDNAAPIEGRYRLVPGSGAHVDGFAYWNGEAKIVGEVMERDTARRIYDTTVVRKRDPGLLEEDGEGAFAFKVFPIAPREKKRVELSWDQWLSRDGRTVRYRAPLTRGDADVVISLTGNMTNLRSPTHRLRIEHGPGGETRLRTDGATKPGPLELDWDVDAPDWQPSATVSPGKADGSDEGWFALSLAAPPMPATATAAKDVTIVIDRSGSMTGDPMQHATTAAAGMIRALSDRDRVNVISFSDEVDPLFRSPQPVAAVRKQAMDYVERLSAGGGTDIALALKTAIDEQDKRDEHPHVIVFMTDGESEVPPAMAIAHADTGNARVFTVGLGADVNRPFLQRLAAEKRGRFTYIANAGEIESKVGALAQRIARPLLVNITVDVQGPTASRMYPRSIPDLFADDEMLVTGRMRGTGNATFVIRGKLEGKEVAFTKTVDLRRASARPWVGSLWAQSRVEHLLEELQLDGSKDELKQEVIDLALAYHFVTPYTTFLAIPESELGTNAAAVAAQRQHRADVLAANNPAPATTPQPVAMPPVMPSPPPNRPGLGTSGPVAGNTPGEVITIQGSAPTIDPTSTVQGVTIDQDYTRNIPVPSRTFSAQLGADEEDDAAGAAPSHEAKRHRVASADAPDYAEGTVHKKGGCAGCATNGRDGLAGMLLVGIALGGILRRRRR